MVEEHGKSTAGNQEFEEICELYLLGELPEIEQQKFEEAYFDDDALFERYLAVKDELLDLYARGELPEEKRVRLAKKLQANASLQRRVNESNDFIRAITQVSEKSASANGASLSNRPALTNAKSSWQTFLDFLRLRPFVWQGAIGALLLIAIIGILIFLRNQQQTTNSEIAVQKPISSPATNQLANETSEVSPPVNTIEPQRNTNNATVPTLEKQTIIPRPKSKTQNSDYAASSPSSDKSIAESKVASEKPKRKPDAATTAKLPVNERAATGFSLTLSTVGRDNGRKIGPAPTSGLNIGGERIENSKTNTGVATQIDTSTQYTSSISLKPFATRSINQANTLRIYRHTKFVRINLTFSHSLNKAEYPTYSAIVTAVDGESIWQDADVEGYVSDDEKIPLGWAHFGFASDLLKKQDYIITLYGHTTGGKKETIAEYYFHIQRVAPTNTPTPKP